MATDPVPRANGSRAYPSGTIASRPLSADRGTTPSRPDGTGSTPCANHARYLVVLVVGSFALPALARTMEALGAPRTPAGVSALLLAVVVIVAILIDRSREEAVAGAALASARPSAEAEESRARV